MPQIKTAKNSKKIDKFINQISVVICNKNSLNFLKKSIPPLKDIKLKELIVIDGCSTDGSLKFLKKNKIKIISDGGKGLSYSRYLGTKFSKGKYIFFIGPDDVCNTNFFQRFSKDFLDNNFDAATVLLRINTIKTYWDKGLNFWFQNIRKIGSTNIIGTPTIFKKNLFKHVKYKVNTIGCDDTDISQQLINKKFKLGVLSTICDQVNNNQLNDIITKFYLYGKSDFNYNKLNNKKSSLQKEIRTIFHPLKHFLNYLFIALKEFNFHLIPFIFIFTFHRYRGLIKTK